MRTTYIHYSSFMAELDHAVLLFDYSEGNIPEIDREKPLLMFASHHHGGHFLHSIFDLGGSRGNMTYVLSDDIRARQVPEDLLGRTILLGPGEEASLKDEVGNPVDIRAFKSTGQGVAFLANPEGRTIYHAGSLNDRVWEGESGTDNHRVSGNFHRGVDKLTRRHIDVVLMLIDPGREKDFYLGMDNFMRMVGADVVFPMHFWGDFQVAARFKALACADGYRDRIQEIHRRGEGFLM